MDVPVMSGRVFVMQVSNPPDSRLAMSCFVNENLVFALYLQHFDPFYSITICPGRPVQIPAKYYMRIPIFYFIVGMLLLANSIYMGMENFAAYFYFAFGILSVLYAVSVHMARSKHRKDPSAEEAPQSESEVHDLP
jgi:hypothetical protein